MYEERIKENCWNRNALPMCSDKRYCIRLSIQFLIFNLSYNQRACEYMLRQSIQNEGRIILA